MLVETISELLFCNDSANFQNCFGIHKINAKTRSQNAGFWPKVANLMFMKVWGVFPGHSAPFEKKLFQFLDMISVETFMQRVDFSIFLLVVCVMNCCKV